MPRIVLRNTRSLKTVPVSICSLVHSRGRGSELYWQPKMVFKHALPGTGTLGDEMNAEQMTYKGYSIFIHTEEDVTFGLWNGRYRILDKDGKVVFESFVPALDEESKAQEAANVEARAWIDGDSDQLSGTVE
jgi:hypothetical protein